MDNHSYVKGMLSVGVIISAPFAWSASTAVPVRVNNYVIPPVFANALYEGMSVPVFIRYDGDNATSRSKQKIADATLILKDNSFGLKQIVLSDLPNNTQLSPRVKSLLQGLENKDIGDGNRVVLNKDASLSLDSRSFYLELTVNQSAIDAATIPRTNMLGESSSEGISGVLNYTTGSYYSTYDGNNSSSNYISLDNTWSLREHHLNLNGSVYGIGTGDRRADLYRAMYERDYQGHRLAMGMVDTWNLQSIASMSALNSSRIYGASYGNKSSTQIEDNTLTLVPVTVFLPAAGEVHVYRDGKLLSIQNFSMGSYEIDTSRLPFGIYNVEVQVVVNGHVVSTRTANINKTFARSSSVTGEVSWQLFGGTLEYQRTDYRKNRNTYYGKKDTWIAGAAAATSKPWLSGVNLKTTLYGFDNNGVNETDANIIFSDMLNLSQQMLLATDSSWQSISTLNFGIPGGFGNVWASRQYGHIGNKLPVQKNDYLTFGITASMSKLYSRLGTLTMSRTQNKYTDSTYTNIDYSQSLFSNRYASVSMRLGVQNYQYENRQDSREKYITLDFSVPFGTWFSAGMTSHNGSMLANASVRKSFSEGALTQVGAAISKSLKNSNNDSGDYQTDNFATSGFASYNTKYNTGTVSVTRGSDNSSNYSLSTHGSVAWVEKSLYAGNGEDAAGLVVNTDFDDDAKMVAQINGQNYPLTGRKNFISLTPYSEYKVELMNDKNAKDSIDIVSGRSSTVTLYPGNISVIKPEVKQLVTVFGRLKNRVGGYYANMSIHNHIGKTHTDERGEFSMDIDKRYPVITVIDNRGGVCEADLNLKDARGAVWIGDISCEAQQQTVANSGETANVY